MSRMVDDDHIDELLSSVRDFVSHKEPTQSRSRILLERLILTPDLMVHDGRPAKQDVNAQAVAAARAADIKRLPPVKTYDKSGLEATIAELEAAVTAQSDLWEADEGENFGKSAWAASAFQTPAVDSSQVASAMPEQAAPRPAEDADMQQFAPAQAAASVVPASPVDHIADAAKESIASSIVSGIDEDALRLLVADIVQEELSGELGERITRNVRKLVRREINRVLTSREMGQL